MSKIRAATPFILLAVSVVLNVVAFRLPWFGVSGRTEYIAEEEEFTTFSEQAAPTLYLYPISAVNGPSCGWELELPSRAARQTYQLWRTVGLALILGSGATWIWLVLYYLRQSRLTAPDRLSQGARSTQIVRAIAGALLGLGFCLLLLLFLVARLGCEYRVSLQLKTFTPLSTAPAIAAGAFLAGIGAVVTLRLTAKSIRRLSIASIVRMALPPALLAVSVILSIVAYHLPWSQVTGYRVADYSETFGPDDLSQDFLQSHFSPAITTQAASDGVADLGVDPCSVFIVTNYLSPSDEKAHTRWRRVGQIERASQWVVWIAIGLVYAFKANLFKRIAAFGTVKAILILAFFTIIGLALLGPASVLPGCYSHTPTFGFLPQTGFYVQKLTLLWTAPLLSLTSSLIGITALVIAFLNAGIKLKIE